MKLMLESYYMKAIVCTKYGSAEVFELKEIEISRPKDDEVLIGNFG